MFEFGAIFKKISNTLNTFETPEMHWLKDQHLLSLQKDQRKHSLGRKGQMDKLLLHTLELSFESLGNSGRSCVHKDWFCISENIKRKWFR